MLLVQAFEDWVYLFLLIEGGINVGILFVLVVNEGVILDGFANLLILSVL